MPSAWALLPVKLFATAKSRLAGVLSREECAVLAECMLQDVLRALSAAPGIAGIALLGREPRLAAIAGAAAARHMEEPEQGDYRIALADAATVLRKEGVRRLLVLAADLPLLTPGDVERVLEHHGTQSPRMTLCPAVRDGGTNGLVLTPPDAMPFLFGPDSARRHLEEAARRNLPAERLEVAGFAQDMDTPEDLRWLLTQRVACATLAWLRASGIAGRLREARPAAAP